MQSDPDPTAARERLTTLLRRDADGLRDWSELFPLVYEELHAIARRRMGEERAQHTLQATALVHEAYLRLVGDDRMDWRSRGHFFGAAAEAMRRVLVDHARKVRSQKRGGDRLRVSISVGLLEYDDEPERVLALDDALTVLEGEDVRAAEVARLRFFAGLEVAEVAAALGVSERTVMREWAFARARLAELLGDGPEARGA